VDAAPSAIEAPSPPEEGLAGRKKETACILILYCHAKEASLVQISPWLGAGLGWRSGGSSDARPIGSLSAGADATIAVASLFQPPGGDNGGKIQVRVGPWGAVESPFDTFRGEGGLSLALRQERFEAWGTLGLRAGVGVDTRGDLHWVGNLSWGIYGEQVRDDACWGACGPKPPPIHRSLFGVTNGVRFFASFRRTVPTDVDEWTFGVELQPEWFLPLSSGMEYRRWFRH
jgi:hypothetical protein